MLQYIHERPDWPNFRLNHEKLAAPLAALRHRQGRLVGRMQAMGFPLQDEATLQTLTLDVLKSSEIEGDILNPDQVRSSIARRLGIDIGALIPVDRHVEGVVEMILDATRNYSAPLTKERLFAWHAALFPTGYSGMSKITVGAWRNDVTGPMQVVSGAIGHEHVHFEAVAATRIDAEMKAFLEWFNTDNKTDPVLRAGIAHLWFVTIHPFDDGNGRMARAIADMALARSEQTAQRFYSMSARIRIERKSYYDTLEKTQKSTLDITAWLQWFLACLDRAFDATEEILGGILRKARFWERCRDILLNDRQRLILNRLLDGFEGKMTSSKWSKIAHCSQDTAIRDINDLVEKSCWSKIQRGAAAADIICRPVSLRYFEVAIPYGGIMVRPKLLPEQAVTPELVPAV